TMVGKDKGDDGQGSTAVGRKASVVVSRNQLSPPLSPSGLPDSAPLSVLKRSPVGLAGLSEKNIAGNLVAEKNKSLDLLTCLFGSATEFSNVGTDVVGLVQAEATNGSGGV